MRAIAVQKQQAWASALAPGEHLDFRAHDIEEIGLGALLHRIDEPRGRGRSGAAELCKRRLQVSFVHVVRL